MQAFTCKQSAEITRHSHSNFSLSFGFLPKDRRVALTRIYAFARLVDDCVDSHEAGKIKRQRLFYWRDQLLNPNPREPLIVELKESMQAFHIPVENFLELIAGCEMDIDKKGYATWDELLVYCQHVAVSVGKMCLQIFDYNRPTAAEFAKNLGTAFQLTNIIRDVGTDLDFGRIYLPQDLLERFHVGTDGLKKKIPSPQLLELLEFMSAQADGFFDKAQGEFAGDHEGKLRPAYVMARTYHKLLEKIKGLNYPVLTQKISLNVFEKGMVLLKSL